MRCVLADAAFNPWPIKTLSPYPLPHRRPQISARCMPSRPSKCRHPASKTPRGASLCPWLVPFHTGFAKIDLARFYGWFVHGLSCRAQNTLPRNPTFFGVFRGERVRNYGGFGLCQPGVLAGWNAPFCVLSTSKRASPRSKPHHALGQSPFLWFRHPMER